VKNIPLILDLGKNLAEYEQILSEHRTFTKLVNQHYPPDLLKGHKAQCQADETTRLGYHGSYSRHCIITTEGLRLSTTIGRVYCPLCLKTWTVYPSILVPRCHYDSYVVQNTLEDTLSHEDTYRAVTRRQAQLTSSGEPKAHYFVHPRTPWHWVLGLGQISLPWLLLSCGLLPPEYAALDEKFLKQNTQRSYAVGLVDQCYELVWWLDYVFGTDQTTLQASLQELTNTLKLVEPEHYFKGITGDSWKAAKNAFAALDPRTQLAECLLHPMLKFEQEVARYARYTEASAEVVAELKAAYWQVLFAKDQPTWESRLVELEKRSEFAHPILADRLASLRRKQVGLCLRFSDPNLALTSSALDRIFARLERKFGSLQQFRTDEGGKATLSAWGIVHNFRRFGPGARRAGYSPVELAGVDLNGLPWLQFVLIRLSKVQWLCD